MEAKKVISQWNKAAKLYTEKQRTAPNNLTNWQILKDALGDVKGKTILDAGCGDGFFSNQLLNLGASVYACDGAETFVEKAKKEFKGIDFKLCDLTKTLPYKENQFDFVVSSLVLMDIDEIDNFFDEAYRILKPDGKLVFSIVHPCFFQAEWEKSESGDRLYKKVVSYYNLDKQTITLWGETTHYHRPLSWYSSLFKRHNFAIESLLENPIDLDNFTPMKPHQRRVPLFVCFTLIKKN